MRLELAGNTSEDPDLVVNTGSDAQVWVTDDDGFRTVAVVSIGDAHLALDREEVQALHTALAVALREDLEHEREGGR